LGTVIDLWGGENGAINSMINQTYKLITNNKKQGGQNYVTSNV
jgi:hypothetical protein